MIVLYLNPMFQTLQPQSPAKPRLSHQRRCQQMRWVFLNLHKGYQILFHFFTFCLHFDDIQSTADLPTEQAINSKSSIKSRFGFHQKPLQYDSEDSASEVSTTTSIM